MRWMRELYVGDRVYRSKKKIVRRIRRHKPLPGVYVLILSMNPSNQVEFFDANTLLQPYYRRQDNLTIVGIAGGYDEAVLLVMRMADECYRKTGSGELRAFLTDRLRREGED